MTKLILSRGFWVSVVALLVFCLLATAKAQELKFPQIITIRYEAPDPRVGGQSIIWVDSAVRARHHFAVGDPGNPLDNTCRIRSRGGFPACSLRRRLATAKPDVPQRL
jgi:hypothetical protein